MAWPEDPRVAADLPNNEWADTVFASMTPLLDENIVGFARSFRDELEALTGDDPEKERQLGSLLIIMAGYGQEAGKSEKSESMARSRA